MASCNHSEKKEKTKILPLSFYVKEDVVFLAQEFLGKYLFTDIDGLTGGMIIETESYAGATDKASHAYNFRRTKRNEAMYLNGGATYVYLCYGMHYMLNVVTNKIDIPHAILIRAIKPTHGVDLMLKRRTKDKIDKTLTVGPGTVTKALGINLSHNALKLNSSSIWIEDRGIKLKKNEILSSERVGVEYAKEDAKLPWRFRIKKEIS
ncbi:MAG: DNA-3-methyladenine glycosylase [Chlamydiae bacterium]|nr:DNA-3-methyladenine glycosylase [Chlamydiota bacterium]